MTTLDDFFCQNYSGVAYEIESDEVAFAAPEDAVALVSVTYVQGRGLNVRVANIPGSDAAMFHEECQEFIVCDCHPPAVWQFTAIGTDGTVRSVSVLEGHEAVHLLMHPDHLLDEGYQSVTGPSLQYTLTPIGPQYPLDYVFKESVDVLTSLGALPDVGGLTVTEVIGADMEDMYAKFMELLEGDDS